jgi:DNA-binding phage protein
MNLNIYKKDLLKLFKRDVKKGLLREISRSIGIHRATLYRLYNGETEPSFNTLSLIAHYYSGKGEY